MKKLSFELTDEQHKNYTDASKKLVQLGIPITPNSLIELLILNQQEEEIISNYLALMKGLVNSSRKKLRQEKEAENDAK